MKKLLLIFFFVSLLIAIIFSLNSKPTLLESPLEITSQVSTAPSITEVQKNTGKVLAVMPQDYKEDDPKDAEFADSIKGYGRDPKVLPKNDPAFLD